MACSDVSFIHEVTFVTFETSPRPLSNNSDGTSIVDKCMIIFVCSENVKLFLQIAWVKTVSIVLMNHEIVCNASFVLDSNRAKFKSIVNTLAIVKLDAVSI